MRPSLDLPFGRSLKEWGDKKAYNFRMDQDDIQYYDYNNDTEDGTEDGTEDDIE